MKTAIEIYKLLPKTNCGACGTPTCFGFAAKAAAGLVTVTDCITMSPAARQELAAAAQNKNESPGTVYDQALESLMPRIRSLDFLRIAPLFGAALIGESEMSLTFLNERYRVTKDGVRDAADAAPRPWISILIYNHLCMPNPPAPSGAWTTFSAIPSSHAKDKAWRGHVEEVIARHFTGNIAGLKTACERMGGLPVPTKTTHDAAFEFHFFPHYPVLLLFDDAVAEENFPAQCTLLLDKNVPYYLDIESIVVLGEEFAGRLTE